METLPEIVKCQRDFAGSVSVEFKGEPGKANEKRNFEIIRGGISWPIRSLPAYLCVIGQYSGVLPGAPLSIRLLLEMQFPTTENLLIAAANVAKDLRFSEYYTDLLRPEWAGFRSRFRAYIQQSREFREIRLLHSPHADDFVFGFDLLKKWLDKGVLEWPTRSIVRHQAQSLTNEDLQSDNPENKFDGINGLRYVAVSFDQPRKPRGKDTIDQGDVNLAWS